MPITSHPQIDIRYFHLFVLDFEPDQVCLGENLIICYVPIDHLDGFFILYDINIIFFNLIHAL